MRERYTEHIEKGMAQRLLPEPSALLFYTSLSSCFSALYRNVRKRAFGIRTTLLSVLTTRPCVENCADTLMKFVSMLAAYPQSNRGYNFGQEVSTYLWMVYIMEVYEIFPNCKSGADFEETVAIFLRSVGFNADRTGKDDGGIDIVAKKGIEET